MITDKQVESALDYLRDNAEDAARCKAQRVYLEEFRKSLKAQIMSEHLAESIGAQERYAYDDVKYRNHLEALKQAVYEDERHRFMRAAAEAKIGAWQTMCANQRGVRI